MSTSIAGPRTAHASSRLVGLFVAALLLFGVVSGVAFTSGAQAATTYSDQEIAFVNLLNGYRVANGLTPLLVSDMISQACDRHNSDMGKYGFFSHYSEHSDWFALNATPWTRMAASGYDFYASKGENIAAGQATAAAAFEAWKASPGHNANMLNSSYRVLGVSHYELAASPYTFYWTTDFGAYVDPTAHTVSSAPTPTVTRFEQNDGRLIYTGAWNTCISSIDTGGSCTYVNATASVTATFRGTYFAYITKKTPAYGYAKITLDGGTPTTIDLYNGSAIYQQKVWNSGMLPDGVHTVKIEWANGMRSAATASNIGVDAFDIAGTLTQDPPVVTPATYRYQQTDSHFRYDGSSATWGTYSTASASGGSYRRASAGSASVTVRFDGTYLAWIATRGTTLGKAYVSLDGGPAQSVDLSRSSVAYQQKVWNTGTLKKGVHTVKIWRNPSNVAGKYISVDAFDVAGTLQGAVVVSPVSTRYEQTDSHFVYTPTWATFSTASASGGSYRRIAATGASVTVTFTGTRLAWIATAGTTLGKALVSLDGGPAQSVNLSRSSVAYQQKVWDTGTLASGRHTVKIWRDPSNLAGKYISVDAFELVGALN